MLEAVAFPSVEMRTPVQWIQRRRPRPFSGNILRNPLRLHLGSAYPEMENYLLEKHVMCAKVLTISQFKIIYFT